MQRNEIEGIAVRLRRGGGPRRRAVEGATVRAYGNDVGKLALRRKVAGDVRVVGSRSLKMVGYGFAWIKYKHGFAKFAAERLNRPGLIGISGYQNKAFNMQGASAFRPKPPRRIGRASRVEYNPLTGSVGIVPNYFSWCNGTERKFAKMICDIDYFIGKCDFGIAKEAA